MKDEAITVDVNMTPAEDAVLYLLKRMRLDANLQNLMLGTEAFARLVRAEAARTGKSEGQVEQTYSRLMVRETRASIREFRDARDAILGELDELPDLSGLAGSNGYLQELERCCGRIRKHLEEVRHL